MFDKKLPDYFYKAFTSIFIPLKKFTSVHYSDGRLSGSAYFNFCHIDQNKNGCVQAPWNFFPNSLTRGQLPVRLSYSIFHLLLKEFTITIRKTLNHYLLYVSLIPGLIVKLLSISLALLLLMESGLINIIQPISKFQDSLFNKRNLKFLSQLSSKIFLLEICK